MQNPCEDTKTQYVCVGGGSPGSAHGRECVTPR